MLTGLLLSGADVNAQKVGLVLSGGGARGLAHIGVIKAMEEHDIPIDYITGTSAGAIVGCLYALGYSAKELDSLARTPDFFNWATGAIDENYTYYFRKREDNASWINIKFSLDSIIQTYLPTNIVSSVPMDFALMELTAPFLPHAEYNFDSLFVPFRCVAADIENKKTVVFKNGDLAEAVRASTAYPFYFKPILSGNALLYDGGMYNNFPSDIMLEEFHPDIIVGINAAGTTTPISENNVISQIRAMMTTPTNFSVLCENGILIEANTDPFGLFDFSRIPEILAEGYRAGIAAIDELKFYIQERQPLDSLTKKRQAFRNTRKEILVDHLIIEGVNSKQAEYVGQILKRSENPISLTEMKGNYFRLVADQHIRSLYPKLRYNKATGYYDMKLKIEREKDLITQFGGNLSSRPISQGYVGAQYHIWGKQSYLLDGNFYFGKLYTSGQVRIRMDAPSRLPYFLEAEATLNQYDFFRSSSAFFSDQKPAYIIKSDQNYGLNFGIPVRNKGKLISSLSYFRVADDYYQTLEFLQKDTADQTILKGMTASITFERSTLNRKQYANQGTFLQIRLRGSDARETNIPGSTSIIRDISTHDHLWYQLKCTYENYFKRNGKLRLGMHAEVATSSLPFFSNYVSTVLNAPSFEPIQESQTLYLENFHAHQYLGIGSKNVIALRNNLDIRLEGYVFMPYRELMKTDNLRTEYGKEFSVRHYIASLGTVFHSPIGPIGAFVNYYDKQDNSFSFLFHVGYFLFNRSALD